MAMVGMAGEAAGMAGRWGLVDIARHVTGCRSSQETRGQIALALDDVASNTCQVLWDGRGRRGEGEAQGPPEHRQ